MNRSGLEGPGVRPVDGSDAAATALRRGADAQRGAQAGDADIHSRKEVPSAAPKVMNHPLRVVFVFVWIGRDLTACGFSEAVPRENDHPRGWSSGITLSLLSSHGARPSHETARRARHYAHRDRVYPDPGTSAQNDVLKHLSHNPHTVLFRAYLQPHSDHGGFPAC